MLKPRIIPCLLIHKGGLVKTVSFAEPKYVGDPINAVKIFNEKEADELIVIDIDASVHQHEPDYKLISNLAAECRMPLCYGGGVKTANQVREIIGLGVEKVALSSAALDRPGLIAEAAAEVGKQSIVVVLDVKKASSSKGYEVWTHNGKINTHRCPIQTAQEAESWGAGEIVINSIDQDGRMKGYDLQLATKVRTAITIPLTVLGGAGDLSDIQRLIQACGLVGASAGSLFVFKGPYKAVLINYPSRTKKNELIFAAQTNH